MPSIVCIWWSFGIVGLALVVIGFARLTPTAWRHEDRGEMLMKMLHVSPRNHSKWPNNTREAWLVVIGEYLGLIFCLIGLVWLLLYLM